MRSLIRTLATTVALISLSLCPRALATLQADSQVTLSWSRNREPDLQGYRIHYGFLPGEYEFTLDADLDTVYTVTNLDDITYYFAVTAYDTAGNESDFSEEVSWTPGQPVGITGGDGISPALPKAFDLSQNFPNPFNPQTTIRFSIAQEGAADAAVHTTLTVYSMRGRAVRTLVDEEKTPGEYLVQWNGENDWGEEMASGTYLYRLQAGSYSSTRKMVLGK